MDKIIKNIDFLEVQDILASIVAPRDEQLAILKLKELFQITSEDMNIERIGAKNIYQIRYENILINIHLDILSQCFVLSPHFDVLNEYDEIIESN